MSILRTHTPAVGTTTIARARTCFALFLPGPGAAAVAGCVVACRHFYRRAAASGAVQVHSAARLLRRGGGPWRAHIACGARRYGAAAAHAGGWAQQLGVPRRDGAPDGVVSTAHNQRRHRTFRAVQPHTTARHGSCRGATSRAHVASGAATGAVGRAEPRRRSEAPSFAYLLHACDAERA